MTSLIPIQTLDKPALDSACNGCGYCCIQEVCTLGRELGDEQHCMALVSNQDGTYACGLILDPYRNCAESPFLQVGDAERSTGFG
jgi:hypothetical protein